MRGAAATSGGQKAARNAAIWGTSTGRRHAPIRLLIKAPTRPAERAGGGAAFSGRLTGRWIRRWGIRSSEDEPPRDDTVVSLPRRAGLRGAAAPVPRRYRSAHHNIRRGAAARGGARAAATAASGAQHNRSPSKARLENTVRFKRIISPPIDAGRRTRARILTQLPDRNPTAPFHLFSCTPGGFASTERPRETEGHGLTGQTQTGGQFFSPASLSSFVVRGTGPAPLAPHPRASYQSRRASRSAGATVLRRGTHAAANSELAPSARSLGNGFKGSLLSE